MVTFTAIAAEILNTQSINELLPDATTREKDYKDLQRQLHPDLHNTTPEATKLATEAFAHLEMLHGQKARTTNNITTKLRTYKLGTLKSTDTLSTTYRCTYEHDNHTRTGQIRFTTNPVDNDLLAAHAKSLKTLTATGDPRLAFIPTYLETFRHKDPANNKIRATIITQNPTPANNWVTLADIKKYYPKGLNPRDAAWMWRRALIALSLAHENNIVNGAPQLMLIHPEQHGLILPEWAYSVPFGQPLKAIPTGTENLYPPETTLKEPAGPDTDLYVLTKTFNNLLAADTPPQIRAFIRGSTLPGRRSRPQDALQALEELTDLIERLWGKRVFRKFLMPTTKENNMNTKIKTGNI